MNSKQSEKNWLRRELPGSVSSKHICEISEETGLSEEIIKLLIFRGDFG